MSPDCRDGSPGADKIPSITAVPQKEKDTGGLLLSDRDHSSSFSLSLVSFTESTSVCMSVTVLFVGLCLVFLPFEEQKIEIESFEPS